MLKILKLLKSNKIIKNYAILDSKKGKDFYYLKIEAKLIDDSTLFIRTYVSVTSYLYSYHWQDKTGQLKIRWDNAPHHQNLKTFPHHKHTPKIEESEEIRLEDILKRIEDKLNFTKP